MQIKDAKVYSFGKLQQKEFHFAPGINVIYGANEAGKSTIHAFLLAMLFGMDKGRGRTLKDDYNRYEPWHAPAYYSGALRFEVEGRPFYLERNFYHREKRELLRNEADGEELSVAYGDLTMLLGGIDKETYGNTYDIPQSGAVTNGELSKVLAEYLSDAAEGGGGATHVARAHDILAAKKKELNAELKNIQSEKEQQKATLRFEQELIGQDAEKLRRDIAAAKLDLEKLNQKLAESEVFYQTEAQTKNEPNVWTEPLQDNPAEASEETHEKKTKSIRTGILAAVIAVCGSGINWGLNAAGVSSKPLFFTLQGILLSGMAAGIFYAGYTAWQRKQSKKNRQRDAIEEIRALQAAEEIRKKEAIRTAEEIRKKEAIRTGEEARKKEAIRTAEEIRKKEAIRTAEEIRKIEAIRTGEEARKKEAIRTAEQMLAMLEENLSEKETRLYNITEQLEGLDGQGNREREIVQDISALDLADCEITRIAGEFCEELEDELNSEVSRYVSAITAGRYDSVRVDEKGGLSVLTDGKEISPEALSRGTLEQFYLALRLAVGNIVTREEPMPICFDEAFAMYDDRRLAQVLKVLAGTGRQILLFTCQRREMDLLEEMGIHYHRVDLS